MLSKEGQIAYTQAAQTNSRRLDVPLIFPEAWPKEGEKFVYVLGDEASSEEQIKTRDILIGLVK